MQMIFGINPILEIFRSHPVMLKKIIVAEGRRGGPVQEILGLAAEHGVPVEFSGREKVERLAPHQVHQGILGVCREPVHATVDDLINCPRQGAKYNLIIILDGVTDPQNLGAIIRSAHCCGANGIIIPQNRAASVTASVAKASAGAAYLLPTATVVNLVRTVEYLKEKGFWIYGADAGSEMDIYAPDYEGHIGLVMGSEGRGIRPLIKKQCDFLITIPMRGDMDSLNVAVAAGVILCEIYRKWGKGA
jgi:23S rRNA (guanosine2251-2'-O)-methyltransferase